MSGTANPEGYMSRIRMSQNLSDDTASEENNITFEYVYETKAGDTSTGSFTLPVQ